MKNVKKLYILLAAIILIICFYIFWWEKPTNEPQDVAALFYKSYEDCLKNPPNDALGRVSVYCQSHTGLTSVDFNQHIEAGGTAKAGADPIVCAQDFPSSFQIGNISKDNTSAKVFVIESFGSVKTVDVPVLLKVEKRQWKVDNIICPIP